MNIGYDNKYVLQNTWQFNKVPCCAQLPLEMSSGSPLHWITATGKWKCVEGSYQYSLRSFREVGTGGTPMTPTLDGTQRTGGLATANWQLTGAWEKSESAVDRQFELHFNAITRTSVSALPPRSESNRPPPVPATLHPRRPTWQWQ